jgi:hypothetical protein
MPDKEPRAEELIVQIRRLTLLWVQKLMADALYERQRTLISEWLSKKRRPGDWRTYTVEKSPEITDLLAQDDRFRLYCETIDQLKWIMLRMGYRDLTAPLFPDHLQRCIQDILAEVIETMEQNEHSTTDDFRRGTYAMTRLYHQHLAHLLHAPYLNAKLDKTGPSWLPP